MATEMQPLYDPSGVEPRWQETWEREGLYARATPSDRDEPSYVDLRPPPNVTGELHMGHALQRRSPDVLIRWHRMRASTRLWQPGYDHAGISTQNVVEKQLAAEGLTRHDLGREAFVERTWDWLERVRRARSWASSGASAPRSTTAASASRWTTATSRAVMTFFVRLYARGWIYRANRIVNWCPFHQTAISDLEVAHEDIDDVLSTIRYPFADGSGHIAIATAAPGDDPGRRRGRRAPG